MRLKQGKQEDTVVETHSYSCATHGRGERDHNERLILTGILFVPDERTIAESIDAERMRKGTRAIHSAVEESTSITADARSEGERVARDLVAYCVSGERHFALGRYPQQRQEGSENRVRLSISPIPWFFVSFSLALRADCRRMNACCYDATALTSSATNLEMMVSITASARVQTSSLFNGTIGCGTVTTSY